MRLHRRFVQYPQSDTAIFINNRTVKRVGKERKRLPTSTVTSLKSVITSGVARRMRERRNLDGVYAMISLVIPG